MKGKKEIIKKKKTLEKPVSVGDSELIDLLLSYSTISGSNILI